MKNFYKYLFLLVLGIIIYLLLNNKDRFSVGIPPSVTYLDFDPTTDPLYGTTPRMRNQNLSDQQTALKDNLQEAIRTRLYRIGIKSFDDYVADIGILAVCKKLKNIRTITSPNRVCLWIGLGYLEYLTNEYIEEEIIIVCDISFQALKYAQDSVKIHQALYPESNKKFLFHLINVSDMLLVREYLLDIIRDNGFVVSLFNISNVFDYLSYDIITNLLDLFNTHEGVSEDMYWIINSSSRFTWYIHKADAVQFHSNTGLPATQSIRGQGRNAIVLDEPQGLSSIDIWGYRIIKVVKTFMNRITQQLSKDTQILTTVGHGPGWEDLSSQYIFNVFEYSNMDLQRDIHGLGVRQEFDWAGLLVLSTGSMPSDNEFFTNSETGSISTLQISKQRLYCKLLLEEETRYFNNCLDTWFNEDATHSVFSQIYDNLLAQITDEDIREQLRILKPFYVHNQREIAYLADKENLDAELLVKFILNPPSPFYNYSNLLDESFEFHLWRKRPGKFEVGYNQRRFVLQNNRLSRYDGDELKGVIMLNTITGLDIVVEGRPPRDFHYLIIQDDDEEFKLWAGEYNSYTFTQSNEDLPTLQQLYRKLQERLNEPNFGLVTSYEGDEFTQLKDALEGVDFNACSAIQS